MREELRILGERPFRSLFLARSVSMLGTSIAPVALTFAVLDSPGGTATDLGLVLAGRSVTQVVFLLYGGVLADRMSRYRLMILSDLTAFLAQACVAVLILMEAGSLGALMALSAVNGAASALFIPASRGVIPEVVTGARLQSANALLRLSKSTSSIAGAAIAGLLVVTVGSGWALAVDALTFLVSALFLLGVRVPDLVRSAPTTSSSLLTELRQGWQEFRSRQWVWVAVAQFAVVNLCFAPSISVLGAVLAKEHMGGVAAWSTILTAQAIGLVSGGLIAMRLRPRFPMRTAVIATFGFLPPFFLFAFDAPFWLVAVSMLVNGVCVDIFEVLWDTALQTHVPPEALSRVVSYDSLGSFVLGPLGFALVGPISDQIGAEETIIAAGSLVLLANLAALLSPSVRSLPRAVTRVGPASRAHD
jgi:MFS family permease